MSYFVIVFSIGFLILIHEAGHFLAARWMKIPVARFSLGFGPKVWGFIKGGTEYRLSLIPLGGYVLPAIEDEDEFFQIPVYKRIVFSLGGPVANFILPLFLFALINTLMSGFSLTGIFVKPVAQTVTSVYKFLEALPLLFSRPDQLSGVVGIVVQGSRFIGADIIKVLYFAVMLSLNLAIFNLLPIPALDGGKVMLYLLEKIHPKMLRLHLPLAVAGWLLLIGLMVYATVLDIGRYV